MVKAEDLQFGIELEKIINIYQDGTTDPLTREDISKLVDVLTPQLNYLTGNIDKVTYDAQLEVRNRPSVQYFLVPVSAINDSSVQFVLVKVDQWFREELTRLHKALIIDSGLDGGSIVNYGIDNRTILVTSDTDQLDLKSQTFIGKLEAIMKKEEYPIIVDVTNEILDSEFSAMQENTEVNWNELTHVDISKSGIYITNQFESDFIESCMLDWCDMFIDIE